MKRVTFLRSLVTLITAPSIIGQIRQVKVEPYKELTDNPKNIGDGYIMIYMTDLSLVRIGDYIMSDMGDRAVCLVMCDVRDSKYIACRAVVRGQYRYKNLNKFQVMASKMQEV